MKNSECNSSILANIVKIRNEKGFSQEYLAQKIGMKQAGYGLIENGDRKLSYELLLQIAVVFEMDIVDIIKYPEKYINLRDIDKHLCPDDAPNVVVQIQVRESKQKEILSILLNNKELELLNN
ncbi:MAG: helix-turn-helix transcriptional regulator [Prevotellaceae bacterium]|jgi:transcriptional regulator with XRE-family HTH domain|nr:helix-turn-helix transcriptional regulator [Prevotellaceae bacterium]